jgi:hypothetical protein
MNQFQGAFTVPTSRTTQLPATKAATSDDTVEYKPDDEMM